MPPKSKAVLGSIQVRNDKNLNRLEFIVPSGTSHKDLSKITLGELLSKFRPKGCQACLSGQDFIIRERFERVLPVEISEKGISF